jgi:hypothetical protein
MAGFHPSRGPASSHMTRRRTTSNTSKAGSRSEPESTETTETTKEGATNMHKQHSNLSATFLSTTRRRLKAAGDVRLGSAHDSHVFASAGFG